MRRIDKILLVSIIHITLRFCCNLTNLRTAVVIISIITIISSDYLGISYGMKLLPESVVSVDSISKQSYSIICWWCIIIIQLNLDLISQYR